MKKKFKFIKVRYTLFLVLCISVSIICGCGGTTHLVHFFQDDVIKAIKDRGAKNIEYASKFYEIGAISDSQETECIKQINKSVEFFINDSSDYSKLMSDLLPAVSFYRYLAMGDVTFLRCSDDSEGGMGDITLKYDNWKVSGLCYLRYDGKDGHPDVRCTKATGKDSSNPSVDELQDLHLSSFSAGNYIAASEYPDDDTGSAHTKNVDEGGSVNPIQFFSNVDKKGSPAYEINQSVHAQVFILKPNILDVANTNSIDGVIELINAAISKDPKIQATELQSYFTEAYECERDSNGNPIEGGETYPIFLIDEKDSYGGEADDVEDYNIITTSKENPDGSHSELGYDMSVDQDFGEEIVEDMIRLRFTEFNEKALDKLKELTDCDAYYLCKDSKGGWKAFYMVYPIEVIDRMEENPLNKEEVNITTKKSGLGINLKTGEYVKYKYDAATDTYKYDEYEPVPNNDKYYMALKAAQNNNADGVAPLIINGYSTDYAIKQFLPNDTHKKQAPTVTVGRIVMSDYLEGTFSPGFVTNEPVVVFGRKIRFNMENNLWRETKDEVNWYTSTGVKKYKQTQLVYNKNTSKEGIAYYVDAEGNKIDTLDGLKITDFAHAPDLQTNKSSHTMRTIRDIEEDLNGKDSIVIKKTQKDGEDETAGNIAQIHTSLAIQPTGMFPGKYVGTVDYKNDSKEKQRMYYITTKFGLFDNALFSNWVNSQSQTASLNWWNTYLGENSFSYDVATEKIISIVADKYPYQLSQNGIVILDLETVATIQDMYNKEAGLETTSKLRTLFIMLGWGIISYSVIIMLCWVIDANLDIGVKLLDKVTFGNWVAVKYEEDIPYRNTNDQTFLDQKKMFVRAIILITLGIILINVNIFNVVLTLIELFGKAASKIEEVIQGFR